MAESLAGDSAQPLKHVAVIMDGNNRWAKARGLPGHEGHRAGVERVRDMIESCRRHRVEVLTLFAFSSENWQRPALEVSALMTLFSTYIKKEAKALHERGIRLRVIGERERFSSRLQKRIADAEALTLNNTEMTLVLAVDYGGRWDIVAATRKLAQQAVDGSLAVDAIDEEVFAKTLCLGDLPQPDLCIRTAGEQRISNFLLWQLAYSELYFADCYWPDFDASAFDDAAAAYFQRQRRFGLSQEQATDAEDDRQLEPTRERVSA
ncbi:MAG: di-trans,poly-cis-decaprenylcistransferase [Gammaproteobacteria bacterium]|nr:di-trans,poly-cis-decaprenylcistransferase [Gammaproteobacteria bacterium]MBQ0839010.1 di-trans,poly-cis-decaprenylcistransferase [Gammaproteobacteria bacterium]